MLRLFESGGMLAVERLPIHGSTIDELDKRRLDEYFCQILEDDIEDWHRTLLNRDLLVAANEDYFKVTLRRRERAHPTPD